MVVRDEIDLIACNLDHLLHQGVDRVLVTDNGSRDGTREVLAWYADHEPVDVHDEPVGPFLQSQWVTRMARKAAEDGATWVVHVDADEFPLHPTMRLRDFFVSTDAEADFVRVHRTDHVALDGAVGDVAPMIQTVRKRWSLNPQGSPLAPKVAHRAHVDAVVAAGNHSVAGPGLVREAVPHELQIHHFPARSLQQAMRKIVHLSDGHLASGLYHSQSVGTVAVGRRRMLDEGTFQAEYRRVYARDDAALSAGLASGELIEDTSVRKALLAARDEGVPRDAGMERERGRDPRPRREDVVQQLQAKATLESVRALIDGPLVHFGELERAQLAAHPPTRRAGELNVVVSDAVCADATLRRSGFDVIDTNGEARRYGTADTPVTVWVWGDGDRPFSPGPSAGEVIARSRPSRTGLDGVMRPADSHHALLRENMS